MTSSAPSLQAQAAAELELRRRARLKPFDEWLGEVSPSWTWDWPHLEYMRGQLGRITSGEIDRLWMSCPPRHGKTEHNTVRYAAWRIECDPTLRVIVWAYSQALAEKFSRKIRRIVGERLPLSTDRNSAGEWETAAGGGVRAAGIGVGITGMGANLILIDDPVKSRLEANSETYRNRVHDSYVDDLVTRAEPGAAIVGTMTRWHEDDLQGRIKGTEEGPDWTYVNLPAIAEENDPLGREPGEALCPDRYPIEVLRRREKVLRNSFYALFQGSPRPAEGNAFKRSWFRYWRAEGNDGDRIYRLLDPLGATVRVVRARDCRSFGTVDLATSIKTSADYTVIAIWAVSLESDLILVDLVRDRLESPDVIKAAADTCRRHAVAYLLVEANGMQLGVVQTMRRAGLAVRGCTKHPDKLSWAQTAIVRVEAGQVFFPERAPWLADYEAELQAFPDGAHDDVVDVTSMAAENVFWSGAATEPDELRAAREKAEAEAELVAKRQRALERQADADDPHWWSDEQ
jgi:predicted phage terminase large subunit-like protein